MKLVGKTVRFHLLPQGRTAFNGVVATAEFVDALVLGENHLGVWISVPELEPASSVMLLRWEHFSTAVVEYEPETPAERAAPGFRP
jgi:hypothetical protein